MDWQRVSAAEGRLRTWFVDGGWDYCTLGLAVLVQLLGGADLFVSTIGLPGYGDGWYIQHGGWSMLQGNFPYTDFYTIMPPATYETSALIALVSGGSPLAIHLATIAVNLCVIAVSVWAIGRLIYRQTGSPRAALAGGLALFMHPLFYQGAFIGFRRKYFVVMFGVLTLLAADYDRWVAAGICSALAPGYWQYAIFFPLLAVGLAIRSDTPRALRRVVGGGLGAAAVVLLPVVLWGGADRMIAGTIVLPFLATGGAASNLLGAMLGDFWDGKLLLLPPVFVLVGMVYRWRTARTGLPRPRWWAVAWVGWFLAGLRWIDYDAAPDLLPLTGGLALLTGFASEWDWDLLRGGVPFLVAVVLVFTVVYPGLTASSLLASSPDRVLDGRGIEYGGAAGQGGLTSTREIFWRQLTPESCYYVASAGGDLETWVELSGDPWNRPTCPSLAAVLDIVRTRNLA
jgi:hypothetical protein